MPIYQNCTSGHWKHGHSSFPILGKIFHYVVGAWGCGFFVFQVLASDFIRFSLFVLDKEVKNMYTILGAQRLRIDGFDIFGYHEGLVIMLIFYLIILFGGFSHFYASLKANTAIESDEAVREEDRSAASRKLLTQYSRSGIRCLISVFSSCNRIQKRLTSNFGSTKSLPDNGDDEDECTDDTRSESSSSERSNDSDATMRRRRRFSHWNCKY